MSKFEILCVTMHQNDFSKLKDMNIHSDVVFANQADRTAYEEMAFEGHTAKMITTTTRGVGKNRNVALLYANAEICLFADDDVTYCDNMEEIVLREFEQYPKADIMIFHLESEDPTHPQRKYIQTEKHKRFGRMPWGCVRVAFRLGSIQKANLWFTTLFGGGCRFPSGEDSIFFVEAKRAGLQVYVSNKTIGRISYAISTWYTGVDEKYFYAKGVFYQAIKRRPKWLWYLYFAWRTKGKGVLTRRQRIEWMKKGAKGYKQMLSFEEYKQKYEE